MLGQQESARILQRVALPRGRVVTTPKLRVATKYTSTYVRACRALFGPFDGQGYMELNQLRPMLERHRLLDPHDEGAAAKLDAWLQRPRDGHITFLDFVDACFTLVGPSLAAKWMDEIKEKRQLGLQEKVALVHWRKHDDQRSRSEMEDFNAVRGTTLSAVEHSFLVYAVA
ncbi:hypothetical protein DYB32_006976 [Aphanomyces invadans]|uniref:EF-hand domain-containing protein n=1 Tax=Aphanomyces invadans TaxID=157072 RepID=A0A3R7D1J8_9STRA|nr:hypothetical protein DYB32_006976 [Aphanomyces invadans]